MPNKSRFAPVALALAVLASALAPRDALCGAPPPVKLQLEGVLRSQGGAPVPDGVYGMFVRLYANEKDSEPAWFDALPAVEVQGGLFAVRVGELKSLDSALFAANGVHWVGVQVGIDPELPRRPLLPVPYALAALSASSLACSGCVGAGHIDPAALAPYAKTASLAKVATSGAYADLAGGPDLGPYAKKAALADVATTGQYADLNGLPDLSLYAQAAALHKVAQTGAYKDLSGLPDLNQYTTAKGLACTGCVTLAALATEVGAAFVDAAGDTMSGDLLVKGKLGVGAADAGWALNVAGTGQFVAVRLLGGAQEPVCDAAKRGLLWFKPGASGAGDGIAVCIKNAADAYQWRNLLSAPSAVQTAPCTSVSNFCGGPNNGCDVTLQCPSGMALTASTLVDCYGNGCTPGTANPQAQCDGKASCVVSFKHTSGCCCDGDDYRTGFAKATCQ